MEAFTLLKYWRGGGSSSSAAPSSVPIPPPLPPLLPPAHTTTTIYHDNAADTDNEEDAAGGDDGSFFDLEFSVGDDVANDCQEDCTDGGDGEFDFTLSSSSCSASSSNDAAELTTAAIALSPSSDEMFSQLVPVMDSSDAFNAKSQQQRIPVPVSLLKSATKFRVFLLGFKKSKANNENPVAQDENKIVSEVRSTDSAADAAAAAAAAESEDDESGKQSKLFTVKFKVEEVPIVSLFTRDNSSSSKSSSSKENAENPSSPAAAAAEERQRFSKEALHKYLKKVKPLYVRVSKRYGEKMRFSSSGQLTLASSAAVNKAGDDIHITPQQNTPSLKSSPSISTEKIQPEAAAAEKSEVHQSTNTKQVGAKQGNLQAGLRVVCKHLGKSRSASSAAVAAAPSPTTSSQRRDDSLLQQQDGIQSAILHCKRSFNASRDSESSRSEEKSSESSASSGGEDGETSSG